MYAQLVKDLAKPIIECSAVPQIQVLQRRHRCPQIKVIVYLIFRLCNSFHDDEVPSPSCASKQDRPVSQGIFLSPFHCHIQLSAVTIQRRRNSKLLREIFSTRQYVHIVPKPNESRITCPLGSITPLQQLPSGLQAKKRYESTFDKIFTHLDQLPQHTFQ